MVSSPEAKRKRYSKCKKQENCGVFEVEEVIGYRLVKSELRFFIKWKGFNDQTWEPTENLVHCSVFRDFVNEKFKSLEKDIYVNVCNIKQKLKKRLREKMSQPKCIAMMDVFPFDPFEFKVVQVFFHLVPTDEAYSKNLENLIIRNQFFKLDQVQRMQNDDLLERIKKKEDVKVTIENDEDFCAPPSFEYITKNFLTDELYMIENTGGALGCKCKVCSKDSDCCPQLKKEQFPYKMEKSGRTTMKLNHGDIIIECGDLCECGSECLNRVSQGRKEIPLCLFKTKDRGWGVRPLANVPKGTFLLEYVGELIGQHEANARPETSYLFDLNHERRTDNHYYTIDAFKYGNLSRFVNHSCEPNASIWFINNCHGDPKNQKIW